MLDRRLKIALDLCHDMTIDLAQSLAQNVQNFTFP